ncbi:efflux RND transporter permease subunit [Klebsiella variicola subsp. variicola]|nr:efflux RND transporter permease subunit [Klebsiella variicola subsp. variicola]
MLKTGDNGVPVYLGDVARAQIGPEMRRGIAELNGEGEVAGGVVIPRAGKNARGDLGGQSEAGVAAKQPAGRLKWSPPTTAANIDRAIDNLSHKLLEEFIVVALVCALFPWHVRSGWWDYPLPLGLCFAFIMMHFQGLTPTSCRWAESPIAVGAMVDAAIVMIENAHKRLEEWEHQHPGEKLQQRHPLENHYRGVGGVGPALFISLLIITLSFIPIFTLEGQEGQTVRPAGLHQNLVDGRGGAAGDRGDPDPDGLLDPRQDPSGEQQPAEPLLIRIYHPLLLKVLHWPKTTLLIALLSILTVIWPLNRVGGEFLPQINEGDLLYMPSTLPGILAAQAADMLQKTDKLIMTVPEVARVFGKTGKAETATDSAPLEMVETTIQLATRISGDRG